MILCLAVVLLLLGVVLFTVAASAGSLVWVGILAAAGGLCFVTGTWLGLSPPPR
jgi:hypothetical protein